LKNAEKIISWSDADKFIIIKAKFRGDTLLLVKGKGDDLSAFLAGSGTRPKGTVRHKKRSYSQ
jgi:hypothetical protein